MSEIISLKGKGDMLAGPETASSREQYPYGTRITLNDNSIEKLGLDFSKFKIGVSGKIVCEYVVVSKSESEYEGKMNRDICLQITGMQKPSMVSEDRMKTGSDLLRKMRKEK